MLTSLFDHIAQHQFGDDVMCKWNTSLHRINGWSFTLQRTDLVPVFYTSSVDDLQISCYRLMCSIYSLGTVKTPHAEKWVTTSLDIWKSKNKSLMSLPSPVFIYVVFDHVKLIEYIKHKIRYFYNIQHPLHNKTFTGKLKVCFQILIVHWFFSWFYRENVVVFFFCADSDQLLANVWPT